MPDMEIYRVLGAKIAHRRKELRLKQAEVAEKIGLTRASLANMEKGRQKIMLHQLYRIAAALSVESILDLVPAKFVFGDMAGPLNLIGSSVESVSDQQKALIEQMIRTAS